MVADAEKILETRYSDGVFGEVLPRSTRTSIQHDDDSITAAYRLGSPGTPKVILIHGINTSCHSLGYIARGLAKDYDVVLYDMYSRGLSKTTKTDHNLELYTEQFERVLERYNWQESEIILIGYSMGGCIAVNIAKKAHDNCRRKNLKISRLILLAPAGLNEAPGCATKLILASKSISEWVIRNDLKSSCKCKPTTKLHDEVMESKTWDDSLQETVLQCYRGLPLSAQDESYKALNIKRMIMFAEHDEKMVPSKLEARLNQIEGDSTLRMHRCTIKGGTHHFPMTHAEDVLKEIRRFLNK